MNETAIIAANLRAIAAEIEASQTEDEKQMEKEFKEDLKKKFIELTKDDPNYKNKDPEQIWQALEKAITFSVKRILGANWTGEIPITAARYDEYNRQSPMDPEHQKLILNRMRKDFIESARKNHDFKDADLRKLWQALEGPIVQLLR